MFYVYVWNLERINEFKNIKFSCEDFDVNI